MTDVMKRSGVGRVAIPFLGAGAGGASALAAGIIVDLADVAMETILHIPGLSWEMGLFILPIFAALGGLPAGFVGALIGRWAGAVIGAIGLGAAALYMVPFDGGPMPMGAHVGSIVMGVFAGLSAGFAGGSMKERVRATEVDRRDSVKTSS